jgi:hypothetical protein
MRATTTEVREPINDGGPAFPVQTVFNPHSGEPMNAGLYWEGNGMTLRDYFAAKAMAAMLSNPANYGANHEWRDEHATVAEQAYEIADDMIQHRDL